MKQKKNKFPLWGKVFWSCVALLMLWNVMSYGQGSAPPSPHRWRVLNDSTLVLINRNASADTFFMVTDSLGISYVQGGENGTVAFLDVLKILDFLLYTGGANFAAYDTTDVPVDGDQLTWGTGNFLDWQPASAGGGEANTLSDSGIYDNTGGFGLAAGKTGVALKVKGLIEGSNITLTKSGDSALTIAGPAGSGDNVQVDTGDGSVKVVDPSSPVVFQEGEAIQLDVDADDTVTVAVEDATSSNKGVATFNPDNFAVSSGDVTIKSGGVDIETELVGTAQRMYFTTAGGAQQSLTLGAANTFLGGNGTSTAPSFQAIVDDDVPNTITIDVADSAQNIDTTSATALALTEKIADVAGGMFTGNTETGIALTYQDADNTVDAVITVVSGLAIDGNNALVAKPGTGLDTTGGTIFHVAHTGDVTGATALDITESVLEEGGSDELAITAGMMNTGTDASSSTFWRGDNTWVTPSGSGLWAQVDDDTNWLPGVSDTLLEVGDSTTYTYLQTSNSSGFLFADNITMLGTIFDVGGFSFQESDDSSMFAIVADSSGDTTLIVIEDTDSTIINPGENAVLVLGDVGLALADSLDAKLLYFGTTSNQHFPRTGVGDNLILKYNLSGDSLEWVVDEGAGGGSTDTAAFVFDDITKYQVDKAIKIAFGAGLKDSGVADSGSSVDTTTLEIDYSSGLALDANNRIVVKPGTGLDTTGGTIFHVAHTGDVTGATGLIIAANAVESTMIGPNEVNDLDINWGTGTDQVNIIDIPSPTTWSTVYWNATVPVALTLGANGDVLTSNGVAAAPTWETPSGGGRWINVGTADTVSLVGVSDSLMVVADTGTSTSIETQNSGGFIFLDNVLFADNVTVNATGTDFTVSGSDNQLIFIHGTGGGGAGILIDEDLTTGDADIEFRVGATQWSIGTDNDASDAFVIARSAVLGTDNVISISTSDVIQFNSAYTFPTADGGANEVLQTDGAGALSFAAVAGRHVDIGTADTVGLIGVSDTLVVFADTGALTSIETQNANGFIFMDPIDVQGNITTTGTVDGVDLAALNTDVAADSASWNLTSDRFDTNYVQITLASVLGAIDAGGATSFELPNVNNPTTDAVGEYAFDANNFATEGFDGANSFLMAQKAKYVEFSVDDPDNLINDSIVLLNVRVEKFPFGIEITDWGILTIESSTYSVNLEHWTDPNTAAGTETNVDAAVATSTSFEAEDDGSLTSPSVAAGSLVVALLPDTDVDQITVWMVFFVNDGD